MTDLLAALLATGVLFALYPPLLHAQVMEKLGALITVRETGQAVLGEGTKQQVREKARLDAIRRAIERYAGVHITSKSTIRNFELEEDVVSSYQRTYVKSVRELAYDYDSANETGTYEGEFVIDTASLQSLAQAETTLSANRDKPVEAAVFLFDGEGRMMEDGGIVRAGDRFNVMVQPVGDLYAYIVNRDSQGHLLNIFPNRDVSSHGNPLRAGIKYYFPPKESDLVFAFDANPGRERFYFLLSAVPLNDMDALFEKLATVQSAEERSALAPILQERLLTRGMALQSKSTQATIVASGDGGGQADKLVGELLKGTGAFVKSVLLHHVR